MQHVYYMISDCANQKFFIETNIIRFFENEIIFFLIINLRKAVGIKNCKVIQMEKYKIKNHFVDT